MYVCVRVNFLNVFIWGFSVNSYLLNTLKNKGKPPELLCISNHGQLDADKRLWNNPKVVAKLVWKHFQVEQGAIQG